jgi:predicted transcriptional regulator
MAERAEHSDLLVLTTEIVSSHLANNQLGADEIPALIQKIYRTLANVSGEGVSLSERPQPAVPIKKSVTP